MLSFAIERGTSAAEVWRLLGEEASLQGDQAMEYLAEHPLEERHWTSNISVDVQAGPQPQSDAVGKAIEWAWGKWSSRRRL
ncbi:hypothetical protein GCM10009657_18930 [Oryzihumus leptocrescens]